MAYAPRSPDLTGTYAPESPELSATYAPQSPDLSTYQAAPPIHPQHQAYRGSISQEPYTPFTPFTPSDPRAQGQYFPPQPTQSFPNTAVMASTEAQMVLDPNAKLGRGRRRGKRVSEGEDDADWQPDEKKTKSEAENGGDLQRPAWAEGVDVKTKFPVARIKRIMQADEDVGKVAQVTPVVVSKALELFMIALVTKSANFAKSSNSKRVTAAHLKQAVTADEQFDFLGEIVSKVADTPAKSEGAEDEDGEAKPKRKGRGPGKGRKKKEDSESP
ncbi:histone-fold-containing protein [Viridothelium virens]|uniref:NCT transcriptional regulatory complex subunit A n=1 Tax=Viridothelium virens TaxID=1048519 RepID=A0A6A6H5Z4_VIRVR|nr:histone-fold-containing protein [Viridothelium virens]